MSQPRWVSFLEANANTFIGFAGSMLLWEFFVKPLYGLATSLADNFSITCIFTVWSIVRGYYVRRYFNRKAYGTKRV